MLVIFYHEMKYNDEIDKIVNKILQILEIVEWPVWGQIQLDVKFIYSLFEFYMDIPFVFHILMNNLFATWFNVTGLVLLYCLNRDSMFLMSYIDNR